MSLTSKPWRIGSWRILRINLAKAGDSSAHSCWESRESEGRNDGYPNWWHHWLDTSCSASNRYHAWLYTAKVEKSLLHPVGFMVTQRRILSRADVPNMKGCLGMAETIKPQKTSHLWTSASRSISSSISLIKSHSIDQSRLLDHFNWHSIPSSCRSSPRSPKVPTSILNWEIPL